MLRLGITGLALILAGCATSHPAAVIEKAGGAMEGVYPLRDFGAVADGVADDTDAIQRAINSAAEKGATVYLPLGPSHPRSPARGA